MMTGVRRFKNNASYAVLQIVKILHSKRMFRCFKNIVLFCGAYFTIWRDVQASSSLRDFKTRAFKFLKNQGQAF